MSLHTQRDLLLSRQAQDFTVVVLHGCCVWIFRDSPNVQMATSCLNPFPTPALRWRQGFYLPHSSLSPPPILSPEGGSFLHCLGLLYSLQVAAVVDLPLCPHGQKPRAWCSWGRMRAATRDLALLTGKQFWPSCLPFHHMAPKWRLARHGGGEQCMGQGKSRGGRLPLPLSLAGH